MTPEEEDLYRDILMSHSRRPCNKGKLDTATHIAEAKHPQKGDWMKVYLVLGKGRVEAIRFEGEGSAVAIASASMMTVAVSGQTLEHGLKLGKALRGLLDTGEAAEVEGDLLALKGIRQFPARIDCALLAWEAFEKCCPAE